MSTATLPAALVTEHPAGQIVLRDVNVAATRASALAGYRMDWWLLGGFTPPTVARVDELMWSETN